jgi:hypothetical protein
MSYPGKRVVATTEVLTRDLSSGRIHRRTLVDGKPQSFEADNLDQAGEFETITADDLSNAEPDDLCIRCFGKGVADDAV